MCFICNTQRSQEIPKGPRGRTFKRRQNILASGTKRVISWGCGTGHSIYSAKGNTVLKYKWSGGMEDRAGRMGRSKRH